MSNRRHSDDGSPDQSTSDADEHHSGGQTRTFEWTDGVEPSVRVVEVVAATTGSDPTALPTLQDAVDVDAMNELLSASPVDSPVRIGFEYADRFVEIDSRGTISVGS